MQPSLLETASSSKQTMCERLAMHFKAHPDTWLDARGLLSVAGFGGWRTRISNLRYPPYNMQIVNRTRREHGYTVSEYKFVTAKTEAA